MKQLVTLELHRSCVEIEELRTVISAALQDSETVGKMVLCSDEIKINLIGLMTGGNQL